MTGLADRLRDQCQHLDRLAGLLDDERTLLGAGTIDGVALGRIARDKQQVLATLAEDDQAQLARHAARPAGQDAARTQGCLPLWQARQARAQEAARMNHFNGRLIALRMTSNQRLINDLRRLSGQNLYGPDGQAQGRNRRLSSEA